jgi:hypothetical protein
VLSRASVVTIPTTLLLLRSSSTHPPCAPRDSLWCFAGYLDTVACMETRPRTWQLCRASRYFILVASRVGQCSWQQFASGDSICAGVAVLLEIRPEGRSHPHGPPDRSHTPDTRTLVTRAAGARLYTLRCPSNRGAHLGGLHSVRRSPLFVTSTAWSPTYAAIIRVGPQIFWRSSLQSGLPQWSNGCYFYADFEFSFILYSLRRLTHPTLPGPITVRQI